MKKCIVAGLLLLFIFGVTTFNNSPVAASTVLSHPLLIPESPAKPIRVKFPNLSPSIAVTALRVLPSGAEIAPDNQSGFNVLCPDLTVLKVSSRGTFKCPEAPKPEVKFLVEVDAPYGVYPPPDGRGPEEEKQLTELGRELEKSINLSDMEDRLKLFLIANLYVTQEAYTQAINQFEDQLKAAPDPAFIRLLGYLYLNRANEGDSRIAWRYYQQALDLSLKINDFEGQALAHHQIALIHQKRYETDEAIKQVEQALALYQTIGLADMATQAQKLLDELRSNPKE